MSEEQQIISAEVVNPNADKGDQRLRLAILGDTRTSRVVSAAFDGPAVVQETFSDVDEVVSFKPGVTFVCLNVGLDDNESLDDAELISVVQKLMRQTQGGVCIKSTISPETVERLMSALDPSEFYGRLVYSPEYGDSSSLDYMLTPDFLLLGGSEDAIKAHMGILENLTMYSFGSIKTGSIMEIVFTKMAISGFVALKQAYFNQLYDTTMEYKVSFPRVRKLIESTPVFARSVAVPTFIRAQTESGVSYKKARSYNGEYLNVDVVAFASCTDKMPIMDEVINFKTLRGE